MKLCYVPCQFRHLTGPYVIETAGGWVEEVRRSRVELVDGRFCLVARLVRVDPTGRCHVRFADGTEAWVYPGPEWKYLPDGSEPYAVADLLDAPTCAA